MPASVSGHRRKCSLSIVFLGHGGIKKKKSKTYSFHPLIQKFKNVSLLSIISRVIN